MQKIIPNLWYDTQAEEAANMYVSIFKNSKITHIARYGTSGANVSGQPEGSVMTVDFELNGQPFIAINGGPIFKFNESVSFMISCENQEEVDYYWEKLIAGGGSPSQCGWLKDKFGLSWQIVPSVLGKLMTSGNAQQSERVMKAMLQMTKLNVAKLEEAAQG